jgi:hypothetical protein
MSRRNFKHLPEFSWDAGILSIHQNFHETPIFYVFANILGGRQYFMILLDFDLCIFSEFIMHLSMRQYFWRNCFNLRFKIDIVVMITVYEVL